MRQSGRTASAERLERIMPDLPSGTVTFLFTDIEGSTAMRGWM
jgi:class 3 adenylate cyclase